MTLLLIVLGKERQGYEYGTVFTFIFRRKHYSDAVTLLNKALKEERNEPVLFTNRGGITIDYPPSTL